MIRKINKNTIICFSLIFIITFSFLVPCFVSASVNTIDSYIPNGYDDQYNEYLDSLKNNPNFESFSNGIVFFSSVNGFGEIGVFVSDLSGGVVELPSAFPSHLGGTIFLGNTASFTCRVTDLESVYFTIDDNLYYGVQAMYSNDFNQYCTAFFESQDDGVTWSVNSFNTGWFCRIIFDNEKIYGPSDIHSFTGLNLDFNEIDFYNWLVDNDKIEVSVDSSGGSVGGKIPGYIGLQKLRSFITFYKQYGGSNTSFFKFIKGWFSYMNIANQTGDNINILKTTMDNLYREYINSYIVTSYPNTLNHAHQRKNIQTNTDDSDTTLITDDPNDSTDISILRDILRGIISLSTSITSHFEALFDKLNELDFTVNVSNNGGSNLTSADIWGSGDITESQNYQALSAAFMDKGVDVVSAESMDINYLDGATQQDSFTVSVVMPDQYINGEFTSKTVTHTIDNTSKMYNTLLMFRKLISFAVIAYFAIRLRFELPHLIRGE